MTTIQALAPTPPIRRESSVAVSGTAAALAHHLGWRVGPTRALFVAATGFLGAGALLYAWLWAFVPLERRGPVVRRLPVSLLLLIAAAASTFVTGVWAVQEISVSYPQPIPRALLVLAAALAVAAGVWAACLDRVDPMRGSRYDIATRLAATGLLGVDLVIAAVFGAWSTGYLLLAAPLLLLGVVAVWSASIALATRERRADRIALIREEHRAEMAAHLHDSVLQTLALIQNRAGASSEVGRLARAQERELRAWLYDGDAPTDSDLITDLRGFAASLELDYAVAITVASAGSSDERASGEVAAAAREAMLNAAKHAGGDISVYFEAAGAAVDVFVRDRGTGFDLDAVPAGRLGVRESIIGRMRRIGGSAHVGPGAGGAGTQVHIRFPAGGSCG